ncbi:hypothetical protein QCA50_005295 [Cerrena zonata]|uniref:Agglutinin n=1 Tax=Cerrena zonata TaxID=2478898 RepID=A0AAW0GF03_9APHY
MSFIGRGIYHIDHAHVPNVRMALADEGSAADGTLVIVWHAREGCYDHMWLIEPVDGGVDDDTYTIRNLKTGTYMCISGSSSKDGTAVIGYHKTNDDSQKWIIRPERSDGRRWKIQSKATGTFLDLLDGGGCWTAVQGWRGDWIMTEGTRFGHQHWLFKPLSETSANIHAILKKNPVVRMNFENYHPDGLYLIPTEEELSSIWKRTELNNIPHRNGIFDCDDYVMAFKTEVAKWGNTTFQALGFSVLCGIMFGKRNEIMHAYNWILVRRDPERIVFFEPQNGAFAKDAWAYTANFGLF